MPMTQICSTLRRVGLTIAIVLATVHPSAAQMGFLGASAPAPTFLGNLGGLAYNDKNHVYLHVFDSARGVWGRFLDANGAAIGPSFLIGTYRLTYSLRGKVAYSRGNAGANVFMVIYTSDANCPDRC